MRGWKEAVFAIGGVPHVIEAEAQDVAAVAVEGEAGARR